MKPCFLGFAGLFLCTVSTATPLHTSLESPGTLSLLSVEQAVNHALAHHPSLAARRAIEGVREAQTAQAKLALLPQAEVSAQLLRATGNVVAGTVWPQPGVPAVTGPPGPAHFDGGAFGSGIGIGGSWDVTGLAARMKLLDGALAAQSEAKYALEARQLEVAYAAADAVLQVWAAQAMVRAEAASVERARMLVTVVEALQRADLRPGADLSRAKAEWSLAQAQKARTDERLSLSEIQLARAIGAAGTMLAVAPMPVLTVQDSFAAPVSNERTTHPQTREAEAAVDVAAAQVQAARMQYLPRVSLVAALWSRGSGLGVQEATGGLLPNAANFGVGVVAAWSPLDSLLVHKRVRAAQAQATWARAQSEEVLQSLETQINTAHASLRSAVVVLQHAPTALAAAKMGEAQAVARYQAGLSRVLEVSDAQRLLLQADMEAALAQVSVLRAQLRVCRAIGDLAPCLLAFRTQMGGR